MFVVRYAAFVAIFLTKGEPTSASKDEVEDVILSVTQWSELQATLGGLHRDLAKVKKDRERDRSYMKNMDKRVKNARAGVTKMVDQLTRIQRQVNKMAQKSVRKKKMEEVEHRQAKVENDVKLYRKAQASIGSNMEKMRNDMKMLKVNVSGVVDDVVTVDNDIVSVKKKLKAYASEVKELRVDMVEMLRDITGDVSDDDDDNDESENETTVEKMKDLEDGGQYRDHVDESSGNFGDTTKKEISERVETAKDCTKCKKLSHSIRILQKALIDRDQQLDELKLANQNNVKQVEELKTNALDMNKTIHLLLPQISKQTLFNDSATAAISEDNTNSILTNRNLIKQVELRTLECNMNFLKYREKLNRKVDEINSTLHLYKNKPHKHQLKTASTIYFDANIKDLNDAMFSFGNRLAHVEVKVLNETLKKCNKEHIDFYQDVKIREQDQLISGLMEKMTVQKQAVTRYDRGLYRLHMDMKENRKNIENVRRLSKKILFYAPQIHEMQGEMEKIQEHLPKDCSEIHLQGHRVSGVYVIHPTGAAKSLKVFCKLSADDAKTVIQRRRDGSVSFSKSWKHYKYGFGSLDGEFWLGNEILSLLTSAREHSLEIDMYDTSGKFWSVRYGDFSVSNEKRHYELRVSGYHGNASDSLSDSNGMSFSTQDVDNDASSTHCGLYYTAGWWYRHCHYCNLNGRYSIGMVWFVEETSEWLQMKETEMRIVPKKSL